MSGSNGTRSGNANHNLLGRILRPIRHRIFQPLIRGASKLALGYDLTSLERRVVELQDMIRAVAPDPNRLWLYENRLERMDATLDMFDAERRAFHLARYQFAATRVSRLVVADIACGTGYGTELLRESGRANRAIGVDIDARTIEYARATHMREGIEFRCASADSTGLAAESVDAVVSFETIEHVTDDKTLIREFHRILRPSGILICSTPNDWPVEMSPTHVRSYNRASFEAVLCGRFEILELHNQNSGSHRALNHGQPAGIRPTTTETEALAECFIAVCRRRS